MQHRVKCAFLLMCRLILGSGDLRVHYPRTLFIGFEIIKRSLVAFCVSGTYLLDYNISRSAIKKNKFFFGGERALFQIVSDE